MAPITYAFRRAGCYLGQSAPPSEINAEIVLAAGSGALLAGTVLGMVTASGKYAPHDPAATNGAEVAAAILFDAASAAGADVRAVATVNGPATIVGAELVFKVGITDEQRAAAEAALRGRGMKLLGQHAGAVAGTPPTPAPAFTVQPSIAHDGTPQVGEAVTVTWAATDATAAVLTIISASDQVLATVNNATSPANVALPAEGHLRARVALTGAGGSASATSAAVTVATAAAPAPTVTQPTIATDGSPAVGEMVTVSWTQTNTASAALRLIDALGATQATINNAVSPQAILLPVEGPLRAIVAVTGPGGGPVNSTPSAAVTVAAAPTSPADFTIASPAEWNPFFAANNGAALSGKKVAIGPGDYVSKSLNITGNTLPITFVALNSANRPAFDRLTVTNLVKAEFEDLLLQQTVWGPGSASMAAVTYAPGSGQVVDQIRYRRCTTRGNYRGNTAKGALDANFGRWPEKANLIPTFNDSGQVVSVTWPTENHRYVGDTLADGTYDIIFSNVSGGPQFTTVPTGWQFTVASGVITGVIAGTPGAATNASSSTVMGVRVKVCSWAGRVYMSERMCFGHRGVAAGTGRIGSIQYEDGDLYNLGNAFKLGPWNATKSELLSMVRNDFDYIYQDYFSVGAGNSASPPLIRFWLNRGQRPLWMLGDPFDPHGDWWQFYFGENQPVNTIWLLDIVGNLMSFGYTIEQMTGMTGYLASVQQFASDEEKVSGATSTESGLYSGRISNNLYLGHGGRGLSVGHHKDLFVWRNTTVGYDTGNPDAVTVQTTFGGSAIAAPNYVPQGRNYIVGNVGESFNADPGPGCLIQDNVSLGLKGATVPYTSYFAAWQNKPTTFAEVVGALAASAGQRGKSGFDPTMGFVDYLNRTIDFTKEHLGVFFDSLTGQAPNTEVWSSWTPVMGGADTATNTVVVPAGAKLQVADDVSGTNAQTTAGPATIGVARGKAVRAGLTTVSGGSASRQVEFVMNGYPVTFAAKTAAVLSYALADNSGTAYSSTTVVPSDSGVRKMLIAFHARPDVLTTNMNLFAMSTAAAFRNYFASGQYRGIVGGTTIGNIRYTAPAAGVTGLHIWAVDLTKTVAAEVIKIVASGQQMTNAGSVDTSGTQSLSMANVLAGGLGLFGESDGQNVLFDGAFGMFYMAWGGAGMALPDIYDPLVQDKFSRDLLETDVNGPLGAAPQFCWFGPVGATDGSEPNTWNATGGLLNRGSLVAPMIRRAGPYS